MTMIIQESTFTYSKYKVMEKYFWFYIYREIRDDYT